MLATQSLSLSLSLHSAPTPTVGPCSPSSSRAALADSTNVRPHSSVTVPSFSKSCVYPTSSVRTGCGWSDLEPPSSSVPTSVHSRHHHPCPTSSPFPVTYKAPPTVSISLSAACSRRISEVLSGSRTQGLEPDLPDVRSVVPFPTAPSDGDMDVDMLDVTSVPCSDTRFLQAPRKRHSAQSSVSSSPGNLGKDVKQKRQRKSKRQVAELWWLGVVHRSILRGIEARQSVEELDASDRLPSGPRELDTMDRVLVEKIQRRLTDNGCVEGRALPNPLPRISSPSISVPSLNLVAPSRKTPPTGSTSFTCSSGLDPRRCGILDGTTAFLSAPKPTRASLSILSDPHSPAPSPAPTSRRRHVRFEILQRPPHSPLRSDVPRRSPSPPARTGAAGANAQTLTLSIPQLVASLTLAHHERSGLRVRGRTHKVVEHGRNAGRSQLFVPSAGVSCSDGDAPFDKENVHESLTLARARLSSAPERKSPLSRVVCVES